MQSNVVDQYQHVELRLDEIAWTDFEKGLPLSGENRALFRRARYSACDSREKAAFTEWYESAPKGGTSADWEAYSWRLEQIRDIRAALDSNQALYERDTAETAYCDLGLWFSHLGIQVPQG